jgi:hypothetical protein
VSGPASRSRARRTCALGLALLPLGLLLGRCATSSEIPFLRQSAAAPWIMPDVPVTAELQQWGREAAPLARFERRFEAATGARAELRLRALRGFQVHLNDRLLAQDDGARWREETRVDLSPALRAGENRLRVDVSNAHGPPLLALRIEGLREPLQSDERWTVDLAGAAHRARIADDTRIEPTSLATETPAEAFARRSDAALLLFVSGALACLGARRLAPARAAALFPVAVGVAGGLAWAGLFVARVSRIPLEVGFDARHHLAYVEWIRREGALPLATDGWSTFHPPLFYVAALATGGSAALLRALPFAAGLAGVLAVFGLARRLFPDEPGRQGLATGFAAVLPMHVYSASYFSNESLHALLAGVALLASVGWILAERPGAARAAGVGALYGLAALTKFTVLLVVPVALLALAASCAQRRLSPGRGLALGAAAGLSLAAVAGWFYARNWWFFGTPLVANWDLPGADQVWWQQPGFHTPAYYARFGEALVHPYLSGFHSFWDSIYSTLWGDGFVAGRARASDRHGFWNYDFMSMGYWVALPATALLVAGGVEASRIALRGGRRGLAFAFLVGCVWVVALGFAYLTLRLPFFAQAKATYALLLTGPLAVFFALAAGRLDALLARWLPARACFWGWLALFAGTLHLGFAG